MNDTTKVTDQSVPDAPKIVIRKGARLLHSNHGWGTVTNIDGDRVTLEFAPSILSMSGAAFSARTIRTRLSSLDADGEKKAYAALSVTVPKSVIRTKRDIWSDGKNVPDPVKIASIIQSHRKPVKDVNDNMVLRGWLHDGTAKSILVGNSLISENDIALTLMRYAGVTIKEFLKKHASSAPDSVIAKIEGYERDPMFFLYKNPRDNSHNSLLDRVMGDAVVYIVRNSPREEVQKCLTILESSLSHHVSLFYDKDMMALKEKSIKNLEKRKEVKAIRSEDRNARRRIKPSDKDMRIDGITVDAS